MRSFSELIQTERGGRMGKGRVFLYVLIYACGWITYSLLVIYLILCFSPFVDPALSDNWLLIFGFFFLPLTIIGVWGMTREEKYMYGDASHSFRKWLYITIMTHCVIFLAIGSVLLKYPATWSSGLLFSIGVLSGALIVVILLYRLWRARKEKGLPW